MSCFCHQVSHSCVTMPLSVQEKEFKQHLLENAVLKPIEENPIPMNLEIVLLENV